MRRGDMTRDRAIRRAGTLGVRRRGRFGATALGTRRRVRRTLPGWMELEARADVCDADLTQYERIPATTVRCAWEDMRDRMPPERWQTLVSEARRRELIDQQDFSSTPTKSVIA